MNIDFFSKIVNPVFSNRDRTAIDVTCDIEGVGVGLRFTAALADPMDYGRAIYQNAMNGDYGEVLPYVEPEGVAMLQTRQKTARELSLEAFALQCAVDEGMASDEQVAELAALRSAIAAMVGQK